MGTKYLIDSNAVIDYLMGRLPDTGMTFMNEVINNIPYVSVISKMEVLGYNAEPDSMSLLVDFFEDAVVFGLTDEVVDKTIELRKLHRVKLPDAIIAATALVNNLQIITRNASDFKNILGLTTLDAHLE
ncbi:MAG TPA: type II toxin-antitoxin system VapC family toxin [Phaeodactylibacter sp.]|nr:type II toxin-antitoxin system VapC family toxin [Phaeodactylibacter sp.]